MAEGVGGGGAISPPPSSTCLRPNNPTGDLLVPVGCCLMTVAPPGLRVNARRSLLLPRLPSLLVAPLDARLLLLGGHEVAEARALLDHLAFPLQGLLPGGAEALASLVGVGRGFAVLGEGVEALVADLADDLLHRVPAAGRLGVRSEEGALPSGRPPELAQGLEGLRAVPGELAGRVLLFLFVGAHLIPPPSSR